MNDSICVVTGASSGLGYGVSLLMARKGAKIIAISRDIERGRSVISELRDLYKGNIDWIPTDLSSIDSVRMTARIINDNYPEVNYLFNCGGVILLERQLTADGLETMFETNYLSHFLLTNLLYNKLLNGIPSKVITVSGRGHKARITEGFKKGTICFDDLQGEKRFSFVKAAKQAVLARIILTYELARRWGDKGIEASTVCPGLTRTNLTSQMPWFVKTFMKLRFKTGNVKTAIEGAAHLIKIAEMKDTNGRYFEALKHSLREARSSEESYDAVTALRLWETSEKLVGQTFRY